MKNVDMFRCVRKLFQREVQRLRSILISSQGHAIPFYYNYKINK